jgi:hypothetical protein
MDIDIMTPLDGDDDEKRDVVEQRMLEVLGMADDDSDYFHGYEK